MTSTDADIDEELNDTEGEPLRFLTSEGRRLVDPPFLRGERTTAADDVYEYTQVHSLGVHVDLTGLREELEAVVNTHSRYDSDIDAAAAPAVHQRLDISRRVASDSDVWHYLTVAEFPEFVRHRWEFTSEAAMREKFLAGGTDIYSNALHRLWWIAELTHDNCDYSLTQQTLEKQTLANKIFDRWFARYRPAAVVCCEELIDVPTDVAEDVTLELNRALSTLQLESMDKPELRSLVRRLIENAGSDIN